MKKAIASLIIISWSVFAQEPRAISIQESYSALNRFNQQKSWFNVIKSANDIMKNYNATPFAKEARYHLAIAYFNLNDFEIADKHFSKYLKGEVLAKYFEDVMQYKFLIAEHYREGSKKRVFGWKKGPKIVEAEDDALKIYDEIISSIPNSDLAAKSFFGKAKIHSTFEEYKESVDALQQVIRRFNKSQYAIESFLLIGKTYLKQTTYKHQNIDLLDLAEVNLQKFKEAFPGEERLIEAEKDVTTMKEIFAKGLFEIGNFYEKTKKSEAAIIYYTKIINSFPQTAYCDLAMRHLQKLHKNI